MVLELETYIWVLLYDNIWFWKVCLLYGLIQSDDSSGTYIYVCHRVDLLAGSYWRLMTNFDGSLQLCVVDTCWL